MPRKQRSVSRKQRSVSRKSGVCLRSRTLNAGFTDRDRRDDQFVVHHLLNIHLRAKGEQHKREQLIGNNLDSQEGTTQTVKARIEEGTTWTVKAKIWP